MTEWRSLIREPLIDLGAYVPGLSAEEVRHRHGLVEVIRLNWNEGLFGPLPGVLEEVAARLGGAWTYPESAYGELRERLAAWLDVDVDQIVPGHGIQALLLTLVAVFVEPGDRVVVPHPTYGLYVQACRAAGAQVERVPCPELALDLERIATAARRSHARLVFVCDPNNPTGLRLDNADWSAFLDALPEGCVVIADASKRVAMLGRFTLPIEVVPFGHATTLRRIMDGLADCGVAATPRLRLAADGAPFVTDNNNLIYDCAFGAIQNAAKLAAAIKSVPGAIEHGLFIGIATTLLIAGPGEVEVINRG